MIDIRCRRQLHTRHHGSETYQIRCQKCSRAYGREVFHEWTHADIAAAIRNGWDVLWIDA